MPDVPADCPSPAEIAAECARIRGEWSEAETMRRLRPDWRPQRVQTPRAGAAVREPVAGDDV